MIGVIADSAEHEVVREFFELFKTPWEFYRQGRRYEVLVCAGGGEFDRSREGRHSLCRQKDSFRQPTANSDRQPTEARLHSSNVLRAESRFTGTASRFRETGTSLLADEETGQCVAYLDRSEERVLVRVGYDLFGEIGTLLTAGQPAANAGMPALELHIAFLRDADHRERSCSGRNPPGSGWVSDSSLA